MIFVVEVTAIYENPGVTPTQARLNQITQDMTAAAAQADRYQPLGVSPADEYLERLPSRYGTGWRARQFITVRATATTLGSTVYTRLNNRVMRDGSKVQVFPDDRDSGGGTEPVVFQRSWPAQPDDIQ